MLQSQYYERARLASGGQFELKLTAVRFGVQVKGETRTVIQIAPQRSLDSSSLHHNCAPAFANDNGRGLLAILLRVRTWNYKDACVLKKQWLLF